MLLLHILKQLEWNTLIQKNLSNAFSLCPYIKFTVTFHRLFFDPSSIDLLLAVFSYSFFFYITSWPIFLLLIFIFTYSNKCFYEAFQGFNELPFIHPEYSWPSFLPFASPLRYSNVTTRPRQRSRKWWRISSMPSAPAWCCQPIGSDSSEEKGFSLWILCSGEVKVQLDGPTFKFDFFNAQSKKKKCKFFPSPVSNVLLNMC